MPNYYVMEGDEEREFSVETLEDGRYRIVKPDGSDVTVSAFQPAKGRMHLLTDGGESHDFSVREDDGVYTVQIRGIDTDVDVLNERQKRMREAGVGGRGASGPDLVSPMAGKIVAVKVAEGDTVEEGQVVVIVEAMKMENDLKAHVSGTVTAVGVGEGQAVEIGDVLVSIEADS